MLIWVDVNLTEKAHLVDVSS